MRLLRGIGAVVVALSLVVMTAPGAAIASTTAHGKWVSGVGTNGGGHGIDPGSDYQLVVTGLWNINEGTQGLQVTGNLRILPRAQQCHDLLKPCPWGVTLQMGTGWTALADGSGYTSQFRVPTPDPAVQVIFDLVLSRPDTRGDVTLTISIQNCPYGWQRWVIQGAAVSG